MSKVPHIDLFSLATKFSRQSKSLIETLNNIDLTNGTFIKISRLRSTDNWDKYALDKLFNNLEALVPPQEEPSFNIHLHTHSEPKKYGKVDTFAVGDYDYKLSAKYLNDQDNIVLISIRRNELNKERVEQEYKEVFLQKPMQNNPQYSADTFQKEEFILKKSLNELVPGYQSTDSSFNLNRIGAFSFTFYYLKNQVSRKEREMYPYNSFSSAERKAWLQNYGGVKIFRDNFSIRPYGENGNDWLGLGERQAQSPGGAGQSLGGFRIRPNQIVGIVNISRITNTAFQDKSGREGIQENEVFDLFKQILLGTINIFEKRSEYNHVLLQSIV